MKFVLEQVEWQARSIWDGVAFLCRSRGHTAFAPSFVRPASGRLGPKGEEYR